jgi:hypothetical protein
LLEIAACKRQPPFYRRWAIPAACASAAEEAEFLFDYARADLLGQKIDVLIPKELGEQHGTRIERFFRSPRRREMGVGMQLPAVNPDGEQFKIKIRLAPIVI